MNKWMVSALFIQIHLAAILSIYVLKILESTASGHWEAVLIGCLLEVLLVWFYLKGLSAFPGKHIGEIIRETAGAWAARAILLPFVAFMLFYLILQNRYQLTKINIVVLPSTPLWAILLLYMVLPFYAARKGIHAIARMSAALFITFMPFVLFFLFVSYPNFDSHNIFPIWKPNVSFVAERPFYASLVAFSGFLFLGMLSLNQPVKLRKLWPSMLLVSAFGFASVYVPLMIFGQETAVLFQYPVTLASDTIDLEWVVFDWLPTFSVVASSALGMIESSVLLWMIMTLVRLLYLPIHGRWLAAILGTAMYILSLRIPNIETINRYFSMNVVLCLYSMLILPLVVGLSGWRKRRTSS